MRKTGNTDLAGRELWDHIWTQHKKHRSVNPSWYHHRAFMRLFDRYLTSGQDKSLLEIGAANSIWLPYFHQRFGYQVVGLDYSPVGCEQTKEQLSRQNVPGEIVLGDLFDENKILRDRFDVVYSFGVVEHFKDPSTALEKVYDFCKPGGLAISIIPNLLGIHKFQKVLSKKIYDAHVPMTPDELAGFHNKVGFEVIEKSYIGFVNLGSFNLSFLPDLIMRAVHLGARITNRVIWWFAGLLNRHPETRAFSPYAVVVAKKNTR